MNERLEKFLKETKIKLMIGGIIGSVVLGGGSIVKAQASNNQRSNIGIESSYEENITLEELTKTGGVTSHLYEAVANRISDKIGVERQFVLDTIVSLNYSSIDETQIPILYPKGTDELKNNADYLMWNLAGRYVDCEISNFASSEIDYNVLSFLDKIYFEQRDKRDITSNDCNDLKECLDLFLKNGEIAGYKFEQLSDSGKTLAIISYEKFRRLIHMDYLNMKESGFDILPEFVNLFQMTDSMDILAMTIHLDAANDSIKNNYQLLTDCLESNACVAIDGFNGVSDEEAIGYLNSYIENRKSDVEDKHLSVSEQFLKSTIFINNFNQLSPKNIATNFGTDININKQFENMQRYLNVVFMHNSMTDVSEHVSLVDLCVQADKHNVAYLESFYKTIRYELENNQLDEKNMSAILNWVLNYYTGSYTNDKNVSARYIDNLSDGGIIVADGLLKQYQYLLKNVKVDNNEVNTLIGQINSINLWQETKGAEQRIYSNFEEKQQSLNYCTVQKGDTLWKIAQKYGMTAQQLYELNRDIIGDNPNLIYPGQELKTNPTYDYEAQFSK